MDKSILMQKQVKDNAEDLQKEFLDMKNWEEQMKHKDEELRKGASGQTTLPPIRSKNKNKTKDAPTKQNGCNIKPKKIKSYDYSAWDKFDVEEACKEIDKEEHSNESEDEVMSKEELEKAHEVATKCKNEGNIFVQQQKWTEAIGCYNQAIRTFPYDAVFYANRALCQLKLNNFCSAEADCSAAIQLDETYVKAYHRRATARVNLKQYKEGKQDLEKVLKLEPSNREAKLLLIQIENKIKALDSVTVLKENTEKLSENTIEKKIAEKMWSSTTPKIQTTDIKDIKYTKQNEEDTKNSKDNKLTKEDTVTDVGDTAKKEKKRDPRIPDWLPEKDDVVVIEPIKKPPHLRSKKSLTRIPIKEVEFGTIQYNHNNEKITYIGVSGDDHDHFRNNGSIKVSESSQDINNIPPVPKTAVQFVINWKRNKSTEFRYKYLKQLSENSLPKIFQDSMESDIFSEILEVLRVEFIKRKESVFCYLKDLSEVKRFRALIMFISHSEKESLRVLFEHCKAVENVSQEEITTLQKKYEI